MPPLHPERPTKKQESLVFILAILRIQSMIKSSLDL
jgi:hypothetical protein